MKKNLLALSCSALCAVTVYADNAAFDWPQFRGPNRDDISNETGLLKEWPADGPLFDPPSLSLLFATYRTRGLPRAWQLARMKELKELAPRYRAVLREMAAKALGELDSGQRYFLFGNRSQKLVRRFSPPWI